MNHTANDPDEIVKVEIVLKRDGTQTVQMWSEEVVAEARYVIFYGLLQRALMDVHWNVKGTKP